MDAAIAGLVGAFGGSGIGLAGSLKISAVQRSEAARVERRRAFAGFLGALYPAVTELREMPPNREPNLLERASDVLSTEQASWVRTRRALVAMGPHVFGRMDRLAGAMAHLQVLDMPEELMIAVEEANDYVVRLGEDRTPERLDEWSTIHGRLHAAKASLAASRPRVRGWVRRRIRHQWTRGSSPPSTSTNESADRLRRVSVRLAYHSLGYE
ncbi:MAG: hypothetical protein ACM3N0_09645 [Chloroflexota bacterium]